MEGITKTLDEHTANVEFGHRALKGSPYRISKEEFLEPANDELRNILLYELNSAISYFLTENTPVYLEGLGIIYPEIRSQQRTAIKVNIASLHIETYRTAAFEKCYDMVAPHREKFRNIIETRQLSQRIYPRLPHFITQQFASAQWESKDLRRLLKLLIDQIKEEIVTKGQTGMLSSVGKFFALHNRQGSTSSQWYAGADIFLEATFHQTIRENCTRRFERPILKSAWEPFEAAYGKPLHVFSIDIRKELRDLGFDIASLGDAATIPLDIAEFIDRSNERSCRRIFCSNGLRLFGLKNPSGKGYGNELVVQLPALASDISGRDAFEIAVSPARLFVAAWVLMQSSKSMTLRHGAGISLDIPLFKDTDSEMKTIMIQPYNRLKSEQQSHEGPFRVMNIISVSDDEALFAQNNSPSLLITLLRHRSLDQHAAPWRPSILSRTVIEKDAHATARIKNKNREHASIAR